MRGAIGDAAFEAGYATGRTFDPSQVLAALGRTDAAAGRARVAHEAQPGMQTALTPRELDVLKLVAQGLSNPGIARHLVLIEHMVHRHPANILRKLGLSSRATAAAWGMRTGLA